MTALGALDHVYYWVTDMDRAVAFYRDVLGLPLLRQDGPSWAVLDAGGIRLALHGTLEDRPMETGGATAVFRVDDLDVARAGLEERGVTFEERAGEVEGLARFATFLDPDGNRVQIIEYENNGGRGEA